jgi:hypothetical protein
VTTVSRPEPALERGVPATASRGLAKAGTVEVLRRTAKATVLGRRLIARWCCHRPLIRQTATAAAAVYHRRPQLSSVLYAAAVATVCPLRRATICTRRAVPGPASMRCSCHRRHRPVPRG